MKANEMPERIYIFDYNDAMVTPIEGDAVYVKEDSFIEKACDWLEKNGCGYWLDDSALPNRDLIEDFRKYMEE